jgi:gliding motility-associated-like protein
MIVVSELEYFCALIKVMSMNIKLLLRIILVCIFLIGNKNIQAQEPKAEIKVEAVGSSCASDKKADVTFKIIKDDGSELDLSTAVFVIVPSKGSSVELKKGENKTKLSPGDYMVYAKEISYDGQKYTPTFGVKLGLKSAKAEYRRCSSEDISVTVSVAGGTGPYKYQLIADGNVIDTQSSASSEFSFMAKTTSSNLQVKVIDDGCAKNTPINVNLEKKLDVSQISEIVEGAKEVCASGAIELSVKNEYSMYTFQWTKDNSVVSTTNTLKIEKPNETHSGKYTLVMTIGKCEYREILDIKVGGPSTPKVTTPVIHLCLNSAEVSLLKYVEATSYELLWYKDGTLIGTTAPKINPTLVGTNKYSVSQKNSTGCESAKTDLTVIVEELPAKIGENNVIVCSSTDSKPKIRVINAGSNTYNLYTPPYSSGTKIGSGKAVNDTALIETVQDLTMDGVYYIETVDVNGCVASDRTTVNVSSKKSLIAGSNKICFGDNLSLSADYAGGKITWTRPDNSISSSKTLTVPNMGFEQAGVYSLLIEESGLNCVMKDKIEVRVTQPNPPVVTKDSFRYYVGEKVSALAATPKSGFTLKWYRGDEAVQQAPVPATDKTGTFLYYVSQDSLGCESPKVKITVVVGNIPASVPASDINVCIADKPVIHITNTVKENKYTVYYKENVIAEKTGTGDEISMTSNVSITENAELEIITSDSYNVSSVATKTKLISVNNLIDLPKSSLSVCDNSTGKLVAVTISDAVYTWTSPSGNMVNESVITIDTASNADAGIYSLSVTTAGCPAAKQTVELKVEKPAKPVTAKEVFYCKGSKASELSATALSGYKLVWFDESQTQLSATPVPGTSAVGTSIYYVSQVSISDVNCSSDMEKITVTVEDKPDSVVLESLKVCSTTDTTQSVSIHIPTSTEGYIYSLYSQSTDGSLVGSSTGNGSAVDITMNDVELKAGTVYYLEVKNKAGCISDRTPVEIVPITVTLSPEELPPYKVEEFYSRKIETNASNPKYSIIEGYLPIGFTISSLGDISGVATSYADPTTFTVEVTNDLGCSVRKEYTLKSELLVSKMFSPNGDGINDVFMKGYKVIMFDRLGRKLYSGDNGWDGAFNSKVVPEDVYYYILYYKDDDGKEQHITGYVTLIKTI